MKLITIKRNILIHIILSCYIFTHIYGEKLDKYFSLLKKTDHNKNKTFIVKDKLHYKNIKKYEARCYIKIHGMIYDINPIGFHDDNTYEIINEKASLDFNMCRDIPNYCHNGKRGLIVDKHKCIRYAGEWSKDKNWKVEKYPNESVRLLIDFPAGDPCPYGGNYTVKFDIVCDSKLNQTAKIINMDEFDPNKCHNKVKMVSPYACPTLKMLSWYQSLFVDKYIIALILIGFGLSLVLFGNIYEKECSFCILIFGFSIFFYKILINFHEIPAVGYLCFAIGAAYLVIYLSQIRYFFLSLTMGYFIGNLIFPFLFEFYNYNADYFINTQDYFFNLCIMTSVGLCVSLYYLVERSIIIYASSFFGSYAVIRGLSLILGHYPDENMTMNLIMKNENNQLDKLFGNTFYYYIISIILLTFLGLVTEYLLRPTAEDNINSTPAVSSKDIIKEHVLATGPIENKQKKNKGFKKKEQEAEGNKIESLKPKINK